MSCSVEFCWSQSSDDKYFLLLNLTLKYNIINLWPLLKSNLKLEFEKIFFFFLIRSTKLVYLYKDSYCQWQYIPTIRSSSPLQWFHNGRDSVSNHQPPDCLLNRLFRRRSKKTSKLRVTGLCAGDSPGTGEFPAQMSSNAEHVSIWWRHHESHWSLESRMSFSAACSKSMESTSKIMDVFHKSELKYEIRAGGAPKGHFLSPNSLAKGVFLTKIP